MICEHIPDNERQMRGYEPHLPFHILLYMYIHFSGGDFMKSPFLTITEHHPAATPLPEEVVRKAITAWLIKEIQK